ncbi:MAG: TIGR00730 family Rossman fold protein [Lachnospiraceae bacterium]|nr:TIGR00730 family Rossman fold protein [Lachnospiraceae bacterium]
MNITVYLGAREGKHPRYREAAVEVGRWIAENGHTLIYGGSEIGLMGVLANTVMEGGGTVIGVEPQFFIDDGLLHAGITKTIPVGTMSERRDKMMELGEGFIALPGGAGTLDEISEVIVMASLGKHGKPCVLYNKGGYYDKLAEFYDQMTEEGFLPESSRRKIIFAENIDEIDAVFCGRK